MNKEIKSKDCVMDDYVYWSFVLCLEKKQFQILEQKQMETLWVDSPFSIFGG